MFFELDRRNYLLVQTIQTNDFSDESKGQTCIEIDDDDDCTFSYVLKQGSEKVEIFAEEEKSKNLCFSFLSGIK